MKTWYERIYGEPPPVVTQPDTAPIEYNEDDEILPWYVKEARKTSGYWAKEDCWNFKKSN